MVSVIAAAFHQLTPTLIRNLQLLFPSSSSSSSSSMTTNSVFKMVSSALNGLNFQSRHFLPEHVTLGDSGGGGGGRAISVGSGRGLRVCVCDFHLYCAANQLAVLPLRKTMMSCFGSYEKQSELQAAELIRLSVGRSPLAAIETGNSILSFYPPCFLLSFTPACSEDLN